MPVLFDIYKPFIGIYASALFDIYKPTIQDIVGCYMYILKRF